MTSLVGQFFREFALTVTYATLFSLLVSFTLTPMMASLILPESETKKHPIGRRLEKIFRAWEQGYRNILSVVLAKRIYSFLAILTALVFFFLSFFSASRVGFEFMPQLDQGDIRMDIELPQGYHLDETAKLIDTIEKRLEKHPEVKHILTQLGSISETDIGTNLANVMVKLVDAEEREISSEEAANLFIKELADIPNARIRVAATMPGAGGDAPIQFFLMGQDIDQLEMYKNEIMDRIKATPGLVNLTTSSRAGKPEITLVPDREKLADAGLTVFDLAMTLRSAVEGIEATRYKEAGEEY
jgi:HAE1 family hydrophobic/amphiphilic exporter-1